MGFVILSMLQTILYPTVDPCNLRQTTSNWFHGIKFFETSLYLQTTDLTLLETADWLTEYREFSQACTYYS